ncbi:CobW family GTP-binding protein [Mesobacterium pallidum]|uniref:CobW family GTP-binding protein n=1 Tax=Mesobacterium pallidum TaxID=2872037 RepID=UPI001EE35CC7|nr:GTP-binding protein [Mesobacterium pallidum]
MDIPVTVIGGYLGAGKTTLVNHLLRHNEGQRLAVLVNEFGELPIDADLIEAEEDGLVSISGGCVCCAYGSDLIGALDDLKAMVPRPDHVLIEASGVALPGAIATTVGLVQGLRADAILVLADADQVQANAANSYLSDTIDRQLAQADILLLTKPDLACDLAAVTDWLRAKAPRARIIPADHGQVPISAVLGALPLPARGHRPDAGAHGLFASHVLRPDGPVDAQALARALAEDPTITRAKGFVTGPTGPDLIHVVGRRHDVEPAATGHETGVVCIGFKGDLRPEALEALLAECVAPA